MSVSSPHRAVLFGVTPMASVFPAFSNVNIDLIRFVGHLPNRQISISVVHCEKPFRVT